MMRYAVAPSASALREAHATRVLLTVAHDPVRAADPTTLHDCAVMLDDVGQANAAQLLRDVAAFRVGGFASEGLVTCEGDTAMLAVAELRYLMTIAADREPCGFPASPAVRLSGHAIVETFPDLFRAFSAALAKPVPDSSFASLLWKVEQAVSTSPGRATLLDAVVGLDDLAAVIALLSVRECLRGRLALALPPFGAPAVFHAAARLSGEGLGAGLSNVSTFAWRDGSVPALIRSAWLGADAVDPWPEALQRFAMLLSIGFDASRLGFHVLELGDLGLTGAVRGILAHVVRQPKEWGERWLLWNIRDVGLDLGDTDLALAAQWWLVSMWPEERGESVVLVELEGNYGDMRTARAFLTARLVEHPDDRAARERLLALEAGEFDIYAPVGGFGSSAYRRAIRAARRVASSTASADRHPEEL